MCPKDKLFKGYIALELKLFEFARARTLYEKSVLFNPANASAWIKFAELERGLDDLERARAVYELAVNQQLLDMPELVWKSYIDFEEEEGEYERTRALYEKLLDKTGHVKVWISYAHFEINVPDEGAEDDEDAPVSEEAKSRARKVFERAEQNIKKRDASEERAALLAAWMSFEATHGNEEQKQEMAKRQPRRVKKRRVVGDGEYEEFSEWVFPEAGEEEGRKKLGGLLEQARRWKEMQAAAAAAQNGGE